MKAARKMLTREPESISGSTKLSAQSSVQREKLANKVEKLVEEVCNMYDSSLKKPSELRPMIGQLRQQFMELKQGETIARCRTWTQFCQKVLHRTDRRIRQILKGTNPATQKHSRKSLPAPKDNDALPQPMAVEIPEAQSSEWTPELVVDTSFNFVRSVFQKANLSPEGQNKAFEQLIDKLEAVVPEEFPCQIVEIAAREGRI